MKLEKNKSTLERKLIWNKSNEYFDYKNNIIVFKLLSLYSIFLGTLFLLKF